MKQRGILGGLLILIFVIYADHGSVLAQEVKPWRSTVDVEAKIGSRSLAHLNLLTPIHQIGDNLLLADVRIVISNDPSTEYNLGVALRRFLEEENQIVGGYIFYDQRRSSLDHLWRQVTAGLELLGEDREFRLNFYLPESGAKGSPGSDEIEYSIVVKGQNVIFQEAEIGGSQERALAGFDVEWGRRIQSDATNSNLRLGLYHFAAPEVPSATGIRTQIETRFDNLLQSTLPGNTIGFSIELQHDTLRGTHGFIGGSLTVPFGKGIIPRNARAGAPSTLLERMTDPIRRDVDVVTVGGKSATKRVIAESGAVNPLTGEVVSSAWFVTATGDGIGTEADPTNFLAVMDEAAENDLIVVKGDDGPIVIGLADTFQLTTGQILIGPGGSVVLAANGDLTKTAEYRPQGIPAVITDGLPTWEEQLADDTFDVIRPSALIELASNTSLIGLTVSGGWTAVNGLDVEEAILIQGNTFVPISDGGPRIHIDSSSHADITIARNRFGTRSETDLRDVINDLPGIGSEPDTAIYLSLASSTVEIVENEIYQAANGIKIDHRSSALEPELPQIGRLVISGNTIDGITNRAIDWMLANVEPEYVEISNNSISRVGESGIVVYHPTGEIFIDATRFGRLLIEGNTIHDVEFEGIGIWLEQIISDGEPFDLTIRDNQLSQSESGISLRIYESEAALSVTDNVLTGLSQGGIHITDDSNWMGSSQLQGVIENNHMSCVLPDSAMIIDVVDDSSLVLGENTIIGAACET